MKTKPGFVEKRMQLCKQKAVPIFKNNNGNGAMLCNWCNKIIHTGSKSDELFCKDCKPLFQKI